MAGITAVILRILPDSPKANIKEIEKDVKKTLEEKGAKNISFEEEEIAFGIKAIKVKFAWPEEKSTDIIENSLSKVKHVSSVKIEDYRRAFG